MMQENHLQSQRRKRGGMDMTSQHDKNFKSTFNSEGKRVVEIFWKQRFSIYLVCKVLYDCKELQIGSGIPYRVITDSYCNRTK
jgi:hypothetical protein